MRQSTYNQLLGFVQALRGTGKTEMSYDEVREFQQKNPQMYVPTAFWGICTDGKNHVNLSKFEQWEQTETSIQAFRQTPVDQTEISIMKPNFVMAETDEQIADRIGTRFAVMDMMANAAFQGNCRSMIIAGAPGVGKSFTILKRANQMSEERCSTLKGAIAPTGLFKTLWKHRHPGHVIVFDDADDVFNNERSLNFLKAACDSSDERFITWASNAEMFDDEGEAIPSTFLFEGSIIFISNKDFIGEIERETRASVHFAAMISRSHFIDTGIKTTREYFIRIKQVVMGTDMLSDPNGTVEIDPNEILQFIEENLNNLNELSLRMVKKLANLIAIDQDNWRKLARVTCFKPGR